MSGEKLDVSLTNNAEAGFCRSLGATRWSAIISREPLGVLLSEQTSEQENGEPQARRLKPWRGTGTRGVGSMAVSSRDQAKQLSRGASADARSIVGRSYLRISPLGASLLRRNSSDSSEPETTNDGRVPAQKAKKGPHAIACEPVLSSSAIRSAGTPPR
jgi:hypothetical protein